MPTFITRFGGTATGPTVAVKDMIDMAGVPTTAGSRVVADDATPATKDADCLSVMRLRESQGRLRFVGKTNLHELAFGITGINPFFGTPPNPVDRSLVPGGSSSGSAVAVATGEATLSLGTDTGGSIRIPAACCGVAGLKTTSGRIPLGGVRPLAPSMDTVGPIAAGVAGLTEGMCLLDAEFDKEQTTVPGRIGRLRVDAHPAIDAAVDASLANAELEVEEISVPGWKAADAAAGVLLESEAAQYNRALLARSEDLGADVASRLERGSRVTAAEAETSREVARAWEAELRAVFEKVDLLALPTLADFPPPLERAEDISGMRCTLPVNLAGLPALSMPVRAGRRPASLQLIGPWMGERLLLAAAERIEAALS